MKYKGINKKGLEELEKKRSHRRWKYEELKKKLLRKDKTWKP